MRAATSASLRAVGRAGEGGGLLGGAGGADGVLSVANCLLTLLISSEDHTLVSTTTTAPPPRNTAPNTGPIAADIFAFNRRRSRRG